MVVSDEVWEGKSKRKNQINQSKPYLRSVTSHWLLLALLKGPENYFPPLVPHPYLLSKSQRSCCLPTTIFFFMRQQPLFYLYTYCNIQILYNLKRNACLVSSSSSFISTPAKIHQKKKTPAKPTKLSVLTNFRAVLW